MLDQQAHAEGESMRTAGAVIVAAMVATFGVAGCGGSGQTDAQTPSGAVTGSVPPFVSNTGLAIVSLYAKGPYQSPAERNKHPETPRPVGPLIHRVRLTPADEQFTVGLAPGVYDGEIRVPKGSFGGGCPWGPGPFRFRVRSGQTTHLHLVRCGHSY